VERELPLKFNEVMLKKIAERNLCSTLLKNLVNGKFVFYVFEKNRKGLFKNGKKKGGGGQVNQKADDIVDHGDHRAGTDGRVNIDFNKKPGSQ